MRRGVLQLGLLIATASPALADESLWHFYPGEPAGGSLAVLEKGELETPEPYWQFAIGCYPGAEWTMTIAGIDAAALGAAISGGTAVQFALVIDGEVGGRGLGGCYPSIAFGEMYGEWEYEHVVNKDLLDELSTASSLGVSGTGIEVAYPGDGFKEGVAALREACGKL